MDLYSDAINYVTTHVGRFLLTKEYRLLNNLAFVMYENHTKEDILESFKLNLDFLAKNKLVKFSLGKEEKFIVRRANSTDNLHQESVIEYSILKDKTIIATFGFYFNVDKQRKINLNISNIQGYVNKTNYPTKEHVLSVSQNNLEKLNNELGVNWRRKIISVFKNYAEKNNYNLIMQLPRRFSHTNEREYIRQIRQYIQTAIKADLSINQISIERINDLKIREKIKNNLEIKKKRFIDTAKETLHNKNIIKKKLEKSVYKTKKKIKR